jgi:protein-S-isoprenylcysteine O-methyltransferase Ste14
MNDQFSEMILVCLILAAIFAVFSSNKRHALLKSLRSWELIALAVIATFTLVTLPLIDATVPWIEFADLPYRDQAGWGGLINGMLAIWLLWRAIADYRVPQLRETKLVRVGIYRYIRYPFYTALLFFASSQLLLSQNWLAGTAGLITFALVYFLRVPKDDEEGLEKYGHAYLEYMTQTGDILPRVSPSPKDRKE